jgi:hypothetical protein
MRYLVGMVDELPEDLSAAGPEVLQDAAKMQDDLMSPLFRRWPRLSRSELAELRRLYSERLRVAKYIGRRRQDRRP